MENENEYDGTPKVLAIIFLICGVGIVALHFIGATYSSALNSTLIVGLISLLMFVVCFWIHIKIQMPLRNKEDAKKGVSE